MSELKASGLLESNLPPDFTVPEPSDSAALMADELPLDAAEDDTLDLLPDPADDDDGGRAA